MPQYGLLQLTLHHISRLYTGTNHIFTDGSCTTERSSSGIFIPSTYQTSSYRLERPTSYYDSQASRPQGGYLLYFTPAVEAMDNFHRLKGSSPKPAMQRLLHHLRPCPSCNNQPAPPCQQRWTPYNVSVASCSLWCSMK